MAVASSAADAARALASPIRTVRSPRPTPDGAHSGALTKARGTTAGGAGGGGAGSGRLGGGAGGAGLGGAGPGAAGAGGAGVGGGRPVGAFADGRGNGLGEGLDEIPRSESSSNRGRKLKRLGRPSSGGSESNPAGAWNGPAVKTSSAGGSSSPTSGWNARSRPPSNPLLPSPAASAATSVGPSPRDTAMLATVRPATSKAAAPALPADGARSCTRRHAPFPPEADPDPARASAPLPAVPAATPPAAPAANAATWVLPTRKDGSRERTSIRFTSVSSTASAWHESQRLTWRFVAAWSRRLRPPRAYAPSRDRCGSHSGCGDASRCACRYAWRSFSLARYARAAAALGETSSTDASSRGARPSTALCHSTVCHRSGSDSKASFMMSRSARAIAGSAASATTGSGTLSSGWPAGRSACSAARRRRVTKRYARKASVGPLPRRTAARTCSNAWLTRSSGSPRRR